MQNFQQLLSTSSMHQTHLHHKRFFHTYILVQSFKHVLLVHLYQLYFKGLRNFSYLQDFGDHFSLNQEPTFIHLKTNAYYLGYFKKLSFKLLATSKWFNRVIIVPFFIMILFEFVIRTWQLNNEPFVVYRNQTMFSQESQVEK